MAEMARTGRFDLVLGGEAGPADLLGCPGLICRRLPRSRVGLRVEAEGMRVRTKDASPEGLFLIGAPDLPRGTILEARLLRAGARHPVRVSLEIVRRVDAPAGSDRISGLGVRVVGAAQGDLERLRRWLAAGEGGSE